MNPINEIDSGEFIIAVAKVLGIEYAGLQTLTVYAEYGYPVTVTFTGIALGNEHLLRVIVERIKPSED